MSQLNESTVWDCYKFIFRSEELEGISDLTEFSINPATQSLFLKFKMRAQTERIRMLEQETQKLNFIVGALASKVAGGDEIIMQFSKLRM